MEVSTFILIILAASTALFISYISMPVIIQIAALKKLIDEPGGRKVHGTVIPTLGGIGIFAAVLISYSILGQTAQLPAYPFLVAALFMLFLIGIKDDILMLSPRKKLFIQVLAAAELVIGGNVILTNLGGLFGLTEIHWIAGALLSILILVAIINAYNLIDGVDGLAGSVGLIISVIMGVLFLGSGHLSLAILSFVLSGALTGFLFFNLNPAKIFMGDTGSMSVGFILGFLALEFITASPSSGGGFWQISNSHVFMIAILIVPVVDTIRVIFVRLMNGAHLFKADRSHIHHKLMELGMSANMVTLSMCSANLLIIVIASQLLHLTMNVQLVLILGMGFLILPAVRFSYLLVNRIQGKKPSEVTV